MCGIVGFTRPGRNARGMIAAMTAALAHRGPDGDGIHVADGVALGHRRLAILDLSDRGRQPMSSPRTGAVISYNGEVYNHLGLRGLVPGWRYRTTCDTETLLALYDAFGPGMVHRLDGMFAFAIHDPRNGRVVLARDRVGIKPLYVARANGRWAWSSELLPFLADIDFPRRIDREALRDYLLFNYVPGPRSILSGVRKLPPGCWAEIDLASDRLTLHRYWNPLDVARAGTATPRTGSAAELSDELESLVLDAVRLRTLSDVPLGCFLSGGTDSSLVAAALSRVSPAPPKTFTISFREAGFDESLHARAVAEAIGSEHHDRALTAADCLELAPRAAVIADEPFADASLLPTAMLSAMTREHVAVSLSGDGGDELFLGYDRYRWADQVAWASRFVPSPVRRFTAGVAARMPAYKLRTAARGMRFPGERELYGYVFAGWNAPHVEALLGEPLDFAKHPFHGLSGALPRASLAERGAFADLCHYLPDDILTKVDRASMHVALEARVPLLDHRIVEFAWALPRTAKMDGGVQKKILRDVLHRFVPAELFDRPKAGFAVPLRHWFRRELRPLVEDLLDPVAIGRAGHFGPDAVRGLVAAHQSGRMNHERQIWALVVFELWRRDVLGAPGSCHHG